MDEKLTEAQMVLHYTTGDYIFAGLVGLGILAAIVGGFIWFLLTFYGEEDKHATDGVHTSAQASHVAPECNTRRVD